MRGKTHFFLCFSISDTVRDKSGYSIISKYCVPYSSFSPSFFTATLFEIHDVPLIDNVGSYNRHLGKNICSDEDNYRI